MNNKGVSRTAPATLGLLKIRKTIIEWPLAIPGFLNISSLNILPKSSHVPEE